MRPYLRSDWVNALSLIKNGINTLVGGQGRKQVTLPKIPPLFGSSNVLWLSLHADQDVWWNVNIRNVLGLNLNQDVLQCSVPPDLPNCVLSGVLCVEFHGVSAGRGRGKRARGRR